MSNKFVRFKTNRDFSRVLSSGYTELSREIRKVLAETGVGATATWGSVTGTLSSQTDLYADLTSHSSRHLPAGIDALTTAAPLANLTAVSTNSEGTANSFSRSDHSHAIDVASVVTSGLLTSTDWNTFNSKQALLVSGANIKTINTTSLLGAGDISVEPVVTAGLVTQYYRGDKTFQILDKTAVGLNNVDNTSDANKPVSTATQTALNLKQDTLVSGTTIKTVNGNSLLGSGDVVISTSSLLNYVETIVNYNILTTDDVVNVTAESVVVTLPSAIAQQGKKISIKSSVNTCTINTSLSQTIDGETSIIINRKWTSISLVSTGTNWVII